MREFLNSRSWLMHDYCQVIYLHLHYQKIQMFLDNGKDWIERPLHHPSSSCNSWGNIFRQSEGTSYPWGSCGDCEGIELQSKWSEHLGMDIDFAATKSHIMSKETPRMKKAFMKLCTVVEGSFISLSFKIPRTWYVPWCCCQCSCKAEAIKSTWPATTSAQPFTNFFQALDYWLSDTLIKIEKGRKPLSGTDQLDLVERE